MVDFHLSSVSFHPCLIEQQYERKNYFIYIKEPSIFYSNRAFSFYDALQLSKKAESDIEKINVKSIATNNHQSIELHFRSKKDQKVISVTIHLPSYHLDISSYVWHQSRKAFLKVDYPEHIDEKMIMGLLQRISIKHQGKITFLSLHKNGLEGGGARSLKQNN